MVRAVFALLLVLAVFAVQAYAMEETAVATVNVSTAVESGAAALRVRVLASGEAQVYQNCKPPLLMAEGRLVMLVGVYAVEEQGQLTVFQPGDQYAVELARYVAEALAARLNSSVTGYFLVFSYPGVMDILQGDWIVMLSLGELSPAAIWNGSLGAGPKMQLVVPLRCHVLGVSVLPAGDVYAAYIGEPWHAEMLYIIGVQLSCSGVPIPGTYYGVPLLLVDAAELGIPGLSDVNGILYLEVIHEDTGARIYAYVTPFIGYPPDTITPTTNPPIAGLGVAWLQQGSVATQSFPLPVTVNVAILLGPLATTAGVYVVQPEPILSPELPEPPALLLHMFLTAAGNMQAGDQVFAPRSIVIPELACQPSLTYNIATGTIQSGSMLVVPAISYSGTTNLTGIEPPRLTPEAAVQPPDIDTPSGIIVTILLFALWIALAASLGLATGTMVAMIVYAVYGVLSGSGTLAVGGAIGFLLAFLYQYITGSR